MDRQIRQFKVVLFVISGLLAVSLGMNAYTVWHLLHVKPMVVSRLQPIGNTDDASLREDANVPEAIETAESICTEPTLLALASNKSFSHGSTKQQMSLLHNWTEDNMAEKYGSWSKGDQKLFLQHLDLVLNQLLAEKEF